MLKILSSLLIFCGFFGFAQVYSNGNVSTGAISSNGVSAPAGYTWSELQGTDTTLGGPGTIGGYAFVRVSDDFSIPVGEKWTISSFYLFAYLPNATSLPYSKLHAQIYIGPPSGGYLIYGNSETSVLDIYESVDSKMYRIKKGEPNTSNKIWKVKGFMNATLNPGTYYMDYQLVCRNQEPVYFVPGTNVNGTPDLNANGLVSGFGNWYAWKDSGSGRNLSLPFILNYVATTYLGTTETRQYDNRVVVYPNPTTDSFKITLPEESLGSKTEIGIFDQSGKKVKSFKISDSYNVKDLEKGIYLLKINDGKNVKATKLIKN